MKVFIKRRLSTTVFYAKESNDLGDVRICKLSYITLVMFSAEHFANVRMTEDRRDLMKVNLLMSYPILPLAMPVSVPIFYLQFLTERDVRHGYINSTNFFLGVEPYPAPSNLDSHYQKLPGD